MQNKQCNESEREKQQKDTHLVQMIVCLAYLMLMEANLKCFFCIWRGCWACLVVSLISNYPFLLPKKSLSFE